MSARTKLVLLVVLFAAPFVAAWLLYFVYPSLRPEGRLNYGELVEPPRATAELRFVAADGAAVHLPKGRWSLVYLGTSACDMTCVERLLLTRQVRRALGRHQEGLQRVYLAPDAEALKRAHADLSAEHPDLLFFAGAGAAAFFQPRGPHDLYLLDAEGRWMMRYGDPITAKGLHKDLKKLLKLFQSG